MNFLGQVNLFHGRVEDGKVHFATLSCDSPDVAPQTTRPVKVFVRPHDFQVGTERNGHPSFRATVTHVHSAGPNVRLELEAESGEHLQAEVSQECYRSERIAVGSRVFVTPRNVRVFADAPAPPGTRLAG
jgi:sulfate transport system ATP-binding protein